MDKMESVAAKLDLLVTSKRNLKLALQNKNLKPTDNMSAYGDLVDSFAEMSNISRADVISGKVGFSKNGYIVGNYIAPVPHYATSTDLIENYSLDIISTGINSDGAYHQCAQYVGNRIIYATNSYLYIYDLLTEEKKQYAISTLTGTSGTVYNISVGCRGIKGLRNLYYISISFASGNSYVVLYDYETNIIHTSEYNGIKTKIQCNIPNTDCEIILAKEHCNYVAFKKSNARGWGGGYILIYRIDPTTGTITTTATIRNGVQSWFSVYPTWDFHDELLNCTADWNSAQDMSKGDFIFLQHRIDSQGTPYLTYNNHVQYNTGVLFCNAHNYCIIGQALYSYSRTSTSISFTRVGTANVISTNVQYGQNRGCFFEDDGYYIVRSSATAITIYQVDFTGTKLWTVVKTIAIPSQSAFLLDNVNGKNNTFITAASNLCLLEFPNIKDYVQYLDFEKTSWYNIKGTLAKATEAQVLEGKSFIGINGLSYGTMKNNGQLTYIPSTSRQSIPLGYTTGGIIEAVDSSIDPNIIAENIKEGITILGIAGTYSVIDSEEYKQLSEELATEKTQNENTIQELQNLTDEILAGEVSIDEPTE